MRFYVRRGKPFNGRINHVDHGRSHVNADAVAFDERDDRVMRNNQFTQASTVIFTFCRNNYLLSINLSFKRNFVNAL